MTVSLDAQVSHQCTAEVQLADFEGNDVPLTAGHRKTMLYDGDTLSLKIACHPDEEGEKTMRVWLEFTTKF